MDSLTTDSLDYLLTLSLEAAITDEQVNQLNLLMRDSAENMQYCIDFISIAACLHKSRGLLDDSGRSFTSHNADERLGEAIERDKQVRAGGAARLDDAHKQAIRKAAEEALERFIIEERRRQEELAYKLYISRRRRLALGIGSLAAVLTIVVCVWLLGLRPHRRTPVKPPTTVMAAPAVAALTHAYEARWDIANIAPIVGTELTSGPIKLIEGLVEIRFKTGARVIVEAPAEMNLVDERTAYLTSGALTAYVPEPVTEFVVETPSVRVTDLGTQFGLLVHGGGATDVHMLANGGCFGVDGYNSTGGRCETKGVAAEVTTNSNHVSCISSNKQEAGSSNSAEALEGCSFVGIDSRNVLLEDAKQGSGSSLLNEGWRLSTSGIIDANHGELIQGHGIRYQASFGEADKLLAVHGSSHFIA